MQHDAPLVVGLVPEAAGDALDLLDDPVVAFGAGVGDAELEEPFDLGPPPLDGGGQAGASGMFASAHAAKDAVRRCEVVARQYRDGPLAVRSWRRSSLMAQAAPAARPCGWVGVQPSSERVRALEQAG